MRRGLSPAVAGYLLPAMAQAALAAVLAGALRACGVSLGYGSAPGLALIALAGCSTALWGIFYQCRFGHRRFGTILRDFTAIRQPIRAYLLVLFFLLLDFGGVMAGGGFSAGQIPPLFAKALLFGGIEELGWRYTFQPVAERRMGYVPAVLVTFICWGVWHVLFFYVDGSLGGVELPAFLAGLLTSCFLLSALYARSGSLWLCVMAHALINALSQTAAGDLPAVSAAGKLGCILLAVWLCRRRVKG